MSDFEFFGWPQLRESLLELGFACSGEYRLVGTIPVMPMAIPMSTALIEVEIQPAALISDEEHRITLRAYLCEAQDLAIDSDHNKKWLGPSLPYGISEREGMLWLTTYIPLGSGQLESTFFTLMSTIGHGAAALQKRLQLMSGF